MLKGVGYLEMCITPIAIDSLITLDNLWNETSMNLEFDIPVHWIDFSNLASRFFSLAL